MNKTMISTLAVAFSLAVAATASAETFWNTNITTNTTWCDGTNTGPIILEAPIFVKNGAVLTIEPGCIVRGQPRTLPADPDNPSTAGTPGALIVTREGYLVAEGSPTNPITFTTAAVDDQDDTCPTPNATPDGIADRDCSVDANLIAYTGGATFLDANPTTTPLAPVDAGGNSNVSLWGGLVLLGNAPTNLAAVCALANGFDIPYGQCFVEGLAIPGFLLEDSLYGGDEVHDSSGILRYVSVRHAGDEIADSNELNGVTIGAGGSGTVLENVEVYCNFDDGFEWFGGAINGRNLHVAFVGDDHIDMDQGYTGTNQYVFLLMPFFSPVGANDGDKMGELDGNDWGEDFNVNVQISTIDDVTNASSTEKPWPQSNPSIYNLTGLGSTPSSQPPGVPAISVNDGLQMRNGFAGEIVNSIVLNTGSEERFDVTDGDGSTTGFNSCTDNVGNDLIRVVATTHDDTSLAGCDLQALTNGDNAVTSGSVYDAPTTATNTQDTGTVLVDELCIFDPAGTGTPGVLSLGGGICDPRPAGTADAVIPHGDDLDESGVFRGAFEGGGVDLWVEGWTAMSQGGLY